jgi:diguanylate cyclase (GGDEF)-like protein
MSIENAVLSLSGLTVGDAFGQRMHFPEAGDLINRREVPPGPWPWTDDTQLALSVVEELRQRSWIDQDYLARRMAWRFSTDPGRGYGNTTRKVLQQIAQGEYFRTISKAMHNGGSFGSTGVSRAVPIGAFYTGMPAKAAREAPLATAITHNHPESLAGAQAVAAAAAIVSVPIHSTGAKFLNEVIGYVAESRVRQTIKQITAIPADDLQSCLKFLCCDNFSSAQTAVPFALWCAAHHLNDYKAALWAAVSGMGQSDTTCAIVGGIVALSSGIVPPDWTSLREPLPGTALLNEIDWPRSATVESRRSDSHKKPSAENSGVESSTISVRVDPLTGLPNLLGLMEWIDRKMEEQGAFPLDLTAVLLVPLWDVNRSAGQTSGDSLIRECAANLKKLDLGEVFRIGGDKFVVVPNERRQSFADANQIARLVSVTGCRLPRVAVVHFPYKEEAADGRFVACIGEALSDKHFRANDGTAREFDAPNIRSMPDFSWMMLDLTSQIRRLGQMVDEANILAQTDPVSQLPNLRMAMLNMEKSLRRAEESGEPMAIMLFDGDNLRQYNEISYEAGDEAIRSMGSTLKAQLRGDDFLARWRTGDEFAFILPATNKEEALRIGTRVCVSVEQASLSWKFNTTMSGGIALYPFHGKTLAELVNAAEASLKKAKTGGKNRVVMSDLEGMGF